MIGNAMILLREELSAYMAGQGDPANVVIENIGLFETENSQNLEDSIVITVVNIEEESTLKNGKTYTKWPDGIARYENRPVFLNLYVLFTSNFAGEVAGVKVVLPWKNSITSDSRFSACTYALLGGTPPAKLDVNNT